MKMGLIILIGGIAGGTVGVQVVKVLRGMGNFEFVVKLVYVLMLGGVGGAMFVESLRTLRRKPAEGEGDMEMTISQPRFSTFFNKLPLKMHFKKSGLHTSAIFPFSIGAMVGFLAALMGVGGGFIMVPAMIYVIGMPTVVAIGTDLFQIVFTTANVTLQQAITNHTVDIGLALILLAGSTIGAQFGAKMSKVLRGEQIRVFLSIIVLVMMVKLLLDLLIAPDSLVGLVAAKGGH
jgi:hypothetical protein